MSRPIDVHRWSDYPELNNCLSHLVAEIEGTEGRRRVRTHQSAKRFRDAVRSVVLDLYAAWSAEPSSVVGVPLGKDRFRPGSRYGAVFLTYDSFIAAFNGLVERGYVQKIHTGFRDERTGKGRVTRVRGTAKLIELMAGPGKLTLAKLTHRTGQDGPEPIILRDKDKNPVSYTDTNYTRAMRDEVERINGLLSGHLLDLNISDAQMLELNARLNARLVSDYRDKERSRYSVDFTAKRLRRIFNNNDWRQGGRFYGGWWQNIPKEYRRFITIDDKRTVEVDYSEMHPLMMYASVGAELVGDAYDIGLRGVPRDVVKLAFNKLVNATGRMKPEPNIDQYGISSAQLRVLVVARHQPISQFFRSGYGSRLQNRDAELASTVMTRFLEMRYVCLPVHDSFIVHYGLEDELKQIMEAEFRTKFGINPGTKTKHGIGYQPAFSTVDTPIRDILLPKGEYVGYETRLNNWWQSKDDLAGG